MKKFIIFILIISVGLLLSCTGDEEIINNTDNNNEQNEEMETPEDFACAMEISDITTDMTADDFTLMNQDGEQVNLYDYRGRYIHIVFMAEWCPMSKAQAEYMADVEDMTEAYPNFVILNVLFHNTDFEGATMEDATEWVKAYRMDMVLAGTEELAKLWNVSLTPTNYVLGQEMEVIGGWSGVPEDADALLEKLEEIAPDIFATDIDAPENNNETD